MFSNPRNIIVGESNVGKSTFLYQLSNFLNENGYSVCLIDGDGSGLSGHLNRFSCPTIDSGVLHLFNKNDNRLFKMVNEIDEIDIILIDDIEYLSNESLDEVSRSNKIIICTKNAHPFYQISVFKEFDNCKILKLNKTTIESDNNIIDRDKYLTQLKREIKLKSLLDEK